MKTGSECLSLAEIVFSAARTDPRRVAILVPGYQLNYQDFASTIAVFAKELHFRGVTSKSFLGLMFQDQFALLCAGLAASMLGCRWICMSAELKGTQASSDITHVIHDNSRLKNDRPKLIYIGKWDFDLKLKPDSLTALGLRGHDDANNIWRVAVSSGSTGRPKFIGVTIGSALKGVNIARDAHLPEHPIIAHFFSPKANVGMNSILRTFAWRGTAILSPTIELLEMHRPAQIVASPAMISKAFSHNLPDRVNKFPTLVSTGSPLTEAFVKLTFDHFDNLINHFGCTELGSISNAIINKSGLSPYPVGKLLDSVDLEIVDENDVRKPLGVEGIVRIRKPTMIGSYIYDEENRSAEVFRNGWFYSGDTGLINVKGELVITGRTRDTLNLGGLKVSAQQIDEYVSRIPGVADCASFAEIDDTAIASLSVLIVSKDGHSVEHIKNSIRADFISRRDKHSLPKRLYFANSVPRNSNGKIMRHLVIEIAREVEPIFVSDVSGDGLLN